MKKKLFYITSDEKLNEYEREHKKISYKTLINRYTQGHIILCNNVANVDEFLCDNIEVGSIYNEEEEEDYYKDIYQYFIANFSNWEIEELKTLYKDELIVAYSEKLDNYILMVDHFGTSWDYVLTDIEYTTDWDEYTAWKKEKDKEGE